MGKLYLYSVFHGSLQYSSIPEKDYDVILDQAFWTILKMCSELDVRLGFELTGWTLRVLQKIDPLFISELKNGWQKGVFEIVGSSYSQTIFPLIPAAVNKYGLDFGISDSHDILGGAPKVAFVNEQTYSSGLPKLYKDAGYKAVVMDWEKAAVHNDYPRELLYRSPKLIGADGTEIRLLWGSTNANRWLFDEYAKGRRNLEEYVRYLRTHWSESEDRAFPLYCADWEIFDYMPFHNGVLEGGHEIARIRELFEYLRAQEWVEFMLPSDVVERFTVNTEVQLTTTECPVISGGPETYNAGRWAVSGVDDVTLNTQCYQILEKLERIEGLHCWSDSNVDSMEDEWRMLNYLWGSNLRTLVTAEKLKDARSKIGEYLYKADRILDDLGGRIPIKGDFALTNPSNKLWQKGAHLIALRFAPGRFENCLSVEHEKRAIPSQLENVRCYPDGSLRSADLVVAPPVIKNGEVLDCRIHQSDKKSKAKWKFDNFRFESTEVIVEFDSAVGGRIKELTFPQISDRPLAGTFDYGFYSHSTADFVLRSDVDTILSDNHSCELEIDGDVEGHCIRIPFRCRIDRENLALWKTYFVYLNEPRIDIRYRFFLKNARPLSLRLGGLTINSEAFNKEKLEYVTTNGGCAAEGFKLSGNTIKQDEAISVQNEWSSTSLTTIPHCLGATEGWLDISDGEKGIGIITDKSLCYSVFLIHYEECEDGYLLRTTASIGEHDSTGAGFWKGYYDFAISFIGHKGGCPKGGLYAAGVNHKLMTLLPNKHNEHSTVLSS